MKSDLVVVAEIAVMNETAFKTEIAGTWQCSSGDRNQLLSCDEETVVRSETVVKRDSCEN